MKKEDIMQWQDAVLEYCKMKVTLTNDRKVIEQLMMDHLKQYFNWDAIVFDDDFNTVKLMWHYGIQPIIKVKSIRDLGIDFIMSNEYDKDMGQCNTIILYPFGLPEDGVYVED